jgi:nicotinamide-nucleotide amidase
MDNIQAEIIAIGTEILLGEITDTNSVYLARRLRDLGINLFFMTSVGDNERRITDAIRIAMGRADVIITCGGLGPTVDDMTRQGVALATERSLIFHQDLLDMIAARFASFRAQMTDNNRQQAYLPENAIVVENPVGTAPAFIVEHECKYVISLPGVPREMKFLMQEKIEPFLRSRFALGVIKAHVLRTAGIGESLLDSIIGKDLLEASNPTVGLAAHAGQVDVRITAKAETDEDAESMINQTETVLRERIGNHVYGVGDARIETVVLEILRNQRSKLTLVEIGLGDAIAQVLKTANGTDCFDTLLFENPVAAYAHYGIDPLISLRTAAEDILKRVQQDMGDDIVIIVMSQPDIEEGADSKSGTAIAVAANHELRSREYGFGGKSSTTAQWVTTWSLSMLWQLIRKTPSI